MLEDHLKQKMLNEEQEGHSDEKKEKKEKKKVTKPRLLMFLQAELQMYQDAELEGLLRRLPTMVRFGHPDLEGFCSDL